MIKILVYRPGSLGDTVVALPALAQIKSTYGDASRITLLIEQSSGQEVTPKDLLLGHSTIETLEVCSGSSGLSRFFRLANCGWGLRRRKFDLVIYLAPSRFSSLTTFLDKIALSLSGASQLIGFNVFPKDEVYPQDVTGRPMEVRHESLFLLDRCRNGVGSDDLVAPVLSFDLELKEEELSEVDDWLIARRNHQTKPLIAIAPIANQQANQWPIDRFRELGRRLIEKFGCEIVIIGGLSHHNIGEEFVSYWHSGINAMGEFNPRVSAALLSKCNTLISLDSGPMHLAYAVGTSCVAIFSDRDNPGRWYPIGHGHNVIRKQVPCGGCRKSTCPQMDHLCIDSITVDEVMNVISDRFQKTLG